MSEVKPSQSLVVLKDQLRVETQGLDGASRPALGSFVLDVGLAVPGSPGSG